MAMQCARCGAAAPNVCANCGCAAYCSKEHQREHWPLHRQDCFPCALQVSDRLGRFLATSRAVPAGTVLVRELPLVVGPRADASRPICLGCHCPLPPASCASCTACRAPVCDVECEKLAAHAQWECKALRRAPAPVPPAAVLPLRCLLGVRSGQEGWPAFLELEAHLDQRRGTAVWSERQGQVVEVLRAAGVVPADGSEDELLQRICGILDVNSFEVRGPAGAGEPLRAVYLRAAMMAHSCMPNCQLSVDDHLQLQVRASCALPRAAPVHYNYCELLESTARRREHLRVGKYFECECARCADPSECGAHLSSLWCPRCLEGLLLPPGPGEAAAAGPGREVRALPAAVVALPASCAARLRRGAAPPPAPPPPAPPQQPEQRREDGAKKDDQNAHKTPSKGGKKNKRKGAGARPESLPEAEAPAAPPAAATPAPAPPAPAAAARSWRCSSCGCGVSARAAQSAVQRCAEAWEAARAGEDGDLDSRGLEQLLHRLSRTLHPHHALQLAAKQVLVALYRDHALAARRPQPHALARMQELCQEILDVLELLQPGHLSRLKGIALHELHVAVALAGGGGGGDLHLQRARDLLRDSLRHLQLEPRDSPEGRLHALALQELAAVEDSLRQDALQDALQGQLQGERQQRRPRPSRRRHK